MKTNLTLTAFAIAGILTCGLANAADTGTITFDGTILDTACTVAPASETQTIALGSSSNTALETGVGATALPTNFAIVIADCPTYPLNISIRFSGVTDTANPALLALSSGSAASGFGIAFFEPDGSTQVNLGVNSAARSVPAANTTLNFVAKLMATSATITPGAYSATADFTVIYD